MAAFDALTAMARRRKTGPGAALLLVLLMVAGCGMQPYDARNHREEGPEQGVFTGSEGEFVIFRYEDKPKSEEEPESEDAKTDTTKPE